MRLLSQLEVLTQATLALKLPPQPPAPAMGKDYLRVWLRSRHPRLLNGAETTRELSRQGGCTAMLIRAIQSPASGRHGTRAAEDAREAAMDWAGAHGRGVGLAREAVLGDGSCRWRKNGQKIIAMKRKLCFWFCGSSLFFIFYFCFAFFFLNIPLFPSISKLKNNVSSHSFCFVMP